MLDEILSQFDQNVRSCLPTTFQDVNTIQLNPRLQPLFFNFAQNLPASVEE